MSVRKVRQQLSADVGSVDHLQLSVVRFEAGSKEPIYTLQPRLYAKVRNNEMERNEGRPAKKHEPDLELVTTI